MLGHDSGPDTWKIEKISSIYLRVEKTIIKIGHVVEENAVEREMSIFGFPPPLATTKVKVHI